MYTNECLIVLLILYTINNLLVLIGRKQCSVDLKEDTTVKDWIRLVSVFFSKNLAVVLAFLTLDDKHNTCTLSVKMILLVICSHCKAGREEHFSACLKSW